MGMPILPLRCICCYSFSALSGSFLYICLFFLHCQPRRSPFLAMSVICSGLRCVSPSVNKKTHGLVSFVTLLHALWLLERLELGS